jgi:ABC-type uncharacterized transport system ATPase subunit
MVYQHFTVVPGMTVAENLLLARGRLPGVINWAHERAGLEAFLADHALPAGPGRHTGSLWRPARSRSWRCSSSSTCKPRLLILDEPTSVLTPQEADEVLGHVRDFARSRPVHSAHHHAQVPRGHGLCRRRVTVLRRGKAVHHCGVGETDARICWRKRWWANARLPA